MRSNIEGSYAILQEAIAAMRPAKWGRIVTVSSILAEDGSPGFAWYTTAKAALHGLVRTLAREVASDGILVNAVMPGVTRSERVAALPDTVQDYLAKGSALRRLLRPDEIASVILYLCSAANSAVTGEVVRVSGGRGPISL
jgi:3-oxoacyl-[acyl-carrier protein] reductase